MIPSHGSSLAWVAEMPRLKVILSPDIVTQALCFREAACCPSLHSGVCSDPEGPLPLGLCHAEAPPQEACRQAASQAWRWGPGPGWGWWDSGGAGSQVKPEDLWPEQRMCPRAEGRGRPALTNWDIEVLPGPTLPPSGQDLGDNRFPAPSASREGGGSRSNTCFIGKSTRSDISILSKKPEG